MLIAISIIYKCQKRSMMRKNISKLLIILVMNKLPYVAPYSLMDGVISGRWLGNLLCAHLICDQIASFRILAEWKHCLYFITVHFKEQYWYQMDVVATIIIIVVVIVNVITIIIIIVII